MNELKRNIVTNTMLATQEQTGLYLTFRVAEERFAMSILDVKEIIEITHVTRVPMTPDFIYGVINLRGNVIPVIDLAARLGRNCAELSKRSCIILVEMILPDSTQLIGMFVDEVREILEINSGHIHPAPDFGTEIRTDFIQAMARVDDDFIILLAIARVLSIDELSQLETEARNEE